MTPVLALVGAVLASVIAAACAYADGALLSLAPEEVADDPPLAALVARRDRAHRALAFARVTGQLVAGAACAVALQFTVGFGVVPVVALAAAGVVLVFASETYAREAGDHAGLRGLHRMRAFTERLQMGLVPVVALGEWFDAVLVRVLPPDDANDGEHEATVEQFRQVVAAEADVGAPGTAMLTGVFDLGQTALAEVMTPRVEIVGVDADASWADMLARVRSSEHSRLVVYREHLDDVVGILYAKDLLPFVVGGTQPPGGWLSLVRTVAFLPSGKRVDAQLRDFRLARQHVAIVADEFGGTAGLVTIEDALELIVGNIQDETDREEPEVEREDGVRFWVAGHVSLDQLSDVLGDDVRHEDVATVGGLVYELLGRVPRPGESVPYHAWRITAERVRRRRVERVFIERAPAAVGARKAR